MSRIYFSLLLAGLLLCRPAAAASRYERGALTFDGIPEAPAALVDKLDDYLDYRQASPLGWSPKGQLLISTRFAAVEQLHLVDQAGAARRQLTFLREPITQAAFSPDPGRAAFVYLKDVGGNENSQLYYQRLGEPAAKLLTDGKSRNGAPIWSNSGKEVAFFTTARDGVSSDIDIVEPESGVLPRLAVSGDGTQWTPLDFSPDDRRLLVLKSVSVAENYLYVVDLGTGQKKEVDPVANQKVGIVDARFSRDGTLVYLISDRDGEFARLRSINLFTGEKVLISSHIPWDIEELAVSRDGHYLAYLSDENGVSKLNLQDLRTRQDLVTPRLPGAGLARALAFDPESKRLAFSYAAPNQPADAYVLEVATGTLDPWTHSEAGAVDTARFVAPRLTQFPSFDRVDNKPRQEAVYVYSPPGPGPHPVLISMHGGPESQFRPQFDPWLQFVVNELGYAVVAPNVRGSSGYGKTYLSLDNGMLREDAVKDLGALLVWIGLQSEFDAKHVVVSGDSYGGYLALAALVNFGDRLRGGVDVAGIADFVTFLTHTAPYRQNRCRAEYGDERDNDMRAYLRRISPLTNADRIAKPLLLVQGRNDPRAPVEDAEQIMNRLRARNAEVRYLLAADEGHGFRKKQNRDAYLRAFADFLATLKQ
jgi:dipeptidyl aminopeptidase/acylaminoacyl peptidase